MSTAVMVEQDGALSEAAASFTERLAARDSLGTAGALEGEPEYEFGDVIDVAFVTDTSFAVLDRFSADIHVFALSGRHLYTIGGKGEGPGELQFPIALVQPHPDRLWVIDGERAVHHFEVDDGVLRFLERVHMPGYAHDACATDSVVVVHTPSDVPGAARGQVLFVVSERGEREAAFAVPYRYDERITARTMKRGRVACLPGQRVAFAPDAQNRLDMYSVPDGERLWHASFEGMRFPRTTEIARRGQPSTVSADIRDLDAFNFFVSLSGTAHTPLVVQLGTRAGADLREGIDRVEIDTYLVDPDTGEGARVSEQVPRILAMHEDLIAFLHTDEFPRVEIHRLGPL